MTLADCRLDQWRIVKDKKGNGLALSGEVSGHPHQRDGATITTSRLKYMDLAAGNVRCESRIYQLGAVDSEWLARLEAMGHALQEFDGDHPFRPVPMELPAERASNSMTPRKKFAAHMEFCETCVFVRDGNGEIAHDGGKALTVRCEEGARIESAWMRAQTPKATKK